MEKITENDSIKENAIRLAKHHKLHCDGETCDISLCLLRRALEKAGIILNEEERKVFS
jgi:hypothetical protein